MAQIVKKFIGNDQVGATKILLENNSYLQGRNAADNADVNLAKINASDEIEFATTPKVGGTAIALVTDIVSSTWNKESLTLNGTDITNQYKDCAVEYAPESVDVVISGLVQTEGVDYTLSVVSGVTRITFAGDLATGGAAELVSGDILRVKGQQV